jgi:putative nucleotidyltransferase with HDIG domain
MISAKDLVARIRTVPPLSGAVVRLLEMTKNETTTTEQIERVVKTDPSLTANLLRVANSAYYRGTNPVSSARPAIVRLGTRGVYEIAMGLSLRNTLPPQIPGYAIDAAGFIRHGVAVGVLSARLARDIKGIDPDEAFTMGLLHDIGKLVVGTFLATEAARAGDCLLDQNLSFEDMEREVLGTDHSEVGFEVARQWHLPEAVGIAARWHHTPNAAPDPASQRIASVVHVADALAHLLGYGEDAGELRRRLDTAVPDQLGLQEEQLETLAGSSLLAIQELADALQTAQA